MAARTTMPTPRTADARERLLRAAIDVFGRRGFAAASTRAIARAAGVNLQSITYYFGGKHGLYLAVADHIAEQIGAQIEPAARRAQARFARRGDRVTVDEARAMLAEILTGMAGILFNEDWMPAARFIVREQMDPSEAFDRLYARVMEPQLEIARRIVGTITGEDPRSTRVRLRTLSLAGSIIFFRIAHAAALRQLGWSKVGPRELAALRELVGDTAASVAAPDRKRKRRAA
jgi:TetR/AcrR family transcriptional regulator, regulator of cefoperazone and chloramphenicol sensitivity